MSKKNKPHGKGIKRPMCYGGCGYKADGIIKNGHALCFPCYDGRPRLLEYRCKCCNDVFKGSAYSVIDGCLFCSENCEELYKLEEEILMRGATAPDISAVLTMADESIKAGTASVEDAGRAVELFSESGVKVMEAADRLRKALLKTGAKLFEAKGEFVASEEGIEGTCPFWLDNGTDEGHCEWDGASCQEVCPYQDEF